MESKSKGPSGIGRRRFLKRGAALAAGLSALPAARAARGAAGANRRIVTDFRRILDDPEAMKLWSRRYEKGWEPKV